MKKKFFSLIFLILLISNCTLWHVNDDKIEPTLVNLSGLNSQYNDYNPIPFPSSPSYPTPLKCSFAIIYSTDRGSSGNNYDIWKGSIDIKQTIKGLTFSSDAIGQFYSAHDSSADEFGPMIITDYLYLYSSNLFYMGMINVPIFLVMDTIMTWV